MTARRDGDRAGAGGRTRRRRRWREPPRRDRSGPPCARGPAPSPSDTAIPTAPATTNGSGLRTSSPPPNRLMSRAVATRRANATPSPSTSPTTGADGADGQRLAEHDTTHLPAGGPQRAQRAVEARALGDRHRQREVDEEAGGEEQAAAEHGEGAVQRVELDAEEAQRVGGAGELDARRGRRLVLVDPGGRVGVVVERDRHLGDGPRSPDQPLHGGERREPDAVEPTEPGRVEQADRGEGLPAVGPTHEHLRADRTRRDHGPRRAAARSRRRRARGSDPPRARGGTARHRPRGPCPPARRPRGS